MKCYNEVDMKLNKSCFFVIPKFICNTYTSKSLNCSPFDIEKEEDFELNDWTTMISTRTNMLYPATHHLYNVGFVKSFILAKYNITAHGKSPVYHESYFAEVSIFKECGHCKISNQLTVNIKQKNYLSIRYIKARHASNIAYLTPLCSGKYMVSFGHDHRC
jgi:hypothetical protein